MTTRLGPTVGWLAVPILAAASLLPGLVVGPSLDAAVFQVAGWRITQGDMLYVDIWDHKPPGIHLVHAMGELLPILDPWVAVWTLTIVATSLTAGLVTWLVRRYVRDVVAVLAGIGCAVGLSHFVLSLGGGLSESFAVLPATAAFGLAAVAGPRSWRAALAGLLTAAAVIVSPQLAPAGLACIVLLLRSGTGVRPPITYAAAGTLAALAVLGSIALQGALPAFVDAVVTYNAVYRQSTAGTSSGPAYGLLPWVTLSLIFLVAPAAAGGLAARRRDQPTRLLLVGSAIWIAGSVALVLLQGRLYGHYALAMVVPLSVLAAVGIDDAWSALRGITRRAAIAMIAGLTAISLGIGAVAAGMELESIEPPNRRARAVAEWIASQAGDGPILVWGNQPRLYRLSKRNPAIRYVYLYPLATGGYATTELIAEVLAQLEDDPPQFIVDAGSPGPGVPGFLPLLVDRPVATDGRDHDLLQPIRAFVADRYEAIVEIDGWLIYRAAPGS